MTEQVKYLKCVSGSVTGIQPGDIRKAWLDQYGQWFLEDLKMPELPWNLTDDLKQIQGLDCFFEEVEQAEEQPKKSQPKFGEILHIKGHPYVFIRIDSDGDWVVYDEKEEVEFCDAETFDEYAPDPTQELRERILERWKGQCLYHAYDTTMSRANVLVGDIVEFVIGNLNAEFDGE